MTIEMSPQLRKKLFAAATGFAFPGDIRLDLRQGPKTDGGEALWAVSRHGFTLNTDGYWELEPLTVGNRSEDYLSRNRFPLQEAYDRMVEAIANPRRFDD